MNNYLSNGQIRALVFLRIFIGWHFLYEGVTKMYNPAWTSKAYLLRASGPFDGFFNWLAGDGMITVIDYLNIFGLMAVGLGLILGYWERIVCTGGILSLLFYYLAQPPFPGVDQAAIEGNYYLVNKNLIEAAALWALYYFPTSKVFGLARLFEKSNRQTSLN